MDGSIFDQLKAQASRFMAVKADGVEEFKESRGLNEKAAKALRFKTEFELKVAETYGPFLREVGRLDWRQFGGLPGNVEYAHQQLSHLVHGIPEQIDQGLAIIANLRPDQVNDANVSARILGSINVLLGGARSTIFAAMDTHKRVIQDHLRWLAERSGIPVSSEIAAPPIDKDPAPAAVVAGNFDPRFQR